MSEFQENNLVNQREKMLTAFNLSKSKFLFFILDSSVLELWNGMYLKIKTPLLYKTSSFPMFRRPEC